VTPRRFVITLFTAAVVAVLLVLQSLSSEAADSRVAPVVLNSDTTIAASLNVVVAGEQIEFQLTLTNNSSRSVEVRFPSGRTHDFAVIDSTGREVWRWSTGKMFTQVLQNKSIAPHDSISFSTAWKNPDTAGTFVAVARLWSRNFPIEQRAELIIPSRQ
jgi:hypothetical protein